MRALSALRDSVVDTALELAREWYAGQEVDGLSVLRHGVEVAMTLYRYVPDAPSEVIALAVLHDAPKLAPAGVDLDEELAVRFGPSAARVVRAVEEQRAALHGSSPALPNVYDPLPLWITAADHIVSLGAVVRMSLFAVDRAAYWRDHESFLRLLPVYRAFHTAAAAHLPPIMAHALGQAVTDAEYAGGTSR